MTSTNDLIIRGGTVIDGTGSAPIDVDVRVVAGRIVEVGHAVVA